MSNDVAANVGCAAMRWRRLDLVALELEERPDILHAKVHAQWKKASRAAADAYDEFMALLADSIAEQEVIE